ncbi:MAG: organomercurial lyase [Ktedonobacterales bacterium]
MADKTLPDGSLPVRVAALSAPARQFHRAVLYAFLSEGRAPTAIELREPARNAGSTVAALLGELVRQDVLQRETDGSIRAAYPFSGRPTAHQVHFDDRRSFYAMCAIDALGLAFMTGQAAKIVTRDPTEATPITIWIKPLTGEQVWDPQETVLLADQPRASSSSAADCCCPLINAFATQAQAALWQQANPEVAVRLLTQEEAVAEARALFEHLLEGEQVGPAKPRISQHRQ